MKIWTLASDDEGGTTSSVHMTERAAYLALIQENLPEEAREEALKELDLDGQEGHDFWEWFNDNKKDSLDTYNIDSHEIDVPAQPKLRVVVRVEGGTAEFLENPDGVDTVLIDYDELGQYQDAALESAISSLPEDLQPEVREMFQGDDSEDDQDKPRRPQEGEYPEPNVLTCEDYDPDTARTKSEKSSLPPDPEETNDSRASWAEAAIIAFESETGTDREDALADLLGDLHHWADRNGQEFDAQLDRSQRYYAEETMPEPKEIIVNPSEVAALADKLGEIL